MIFKPFIYIQRGFSKGGWVGTILFVIYRLFLKKLKSVIWKLGKLPLAGKYTLIDQLFSSETNICDIGKGNRRKYLDICIFRAQKWPKRGKIGVKFRYSPNKSILHIDFCKCSPNRYFIVITLLWTS